jgi:hypothetical protein
MRVPDPIHEPQDQIGQRAVHSVVLYDDRAPGNPLRFSQEHHRIVGMVDTSTNITASKFLSSK